MKIPTVMYLALHRTVTSRRGGSPHAAAGAREFVLWASKRQEVRWLHYRVPDGVLKETLLQDLAQLLGVSSVVRQSIHGFDWEATGSRSGYPAERVT